jgi:2-amino-4-hydroxy-6-hydroxymethyldihydropteridine diphosphokinase
MYVTDQPPYLNAVGEVFSTLSPRAFLCRLHEIERDFGRDRSREIRMGPRTLDLDILLCDRLIVDEPDLRIPHPRITERLFVLVPLVEIAADLTDPRTSIPYARTLRELS